MNGNRFRSDSNGYPHIFEYARPEYDTADIVRQRPTSETQMSATKPEVGITFKRKQPMSDNVGYIWVGHGRMCGCSRWNRFKICFRSKFIFTSGFYFRFRSRHFSFRCRPMSDNIGNVIFGSGILENVGVAVGIASPSVSAQKLFPLPVSWPTFEFPMSGDVGQCRHCHTRVGRCRKCGSSL